ncbi:efflux RND transporter periplasmic adaptor subunit [Flavivirga spongiicola]|uniref:Efflux RND transporter periplasmic adaptor subunit n=1 Tax=Flavivirga spongiicola TaxID=421621 RepID=A0ABU7XUV3_9FLAO|nr:efflux RND transporter periplasmic adaptor subunit [Flavivirga sp. MEBiC05379]MDO5979293.1 efflux RND transporter periplasmic adaptor subunit [Flavivirga sp. MEBiC05379]
MKNILILSFVTLVLASCGADKKMAVEDIIASGNLEQIRKKKAELDASAQEISSQLKQLESEIKKLDPQERIPLITTFETKEAVFNHYVELQGNVSTKKNLVIYPEYSGTLTRVYVKEGQKVVKGQILAKIDDGGLSQQVAQLQIQAELAKTTFERQERLWNQKIGSEIQYLQAKSTYEAQQRAVNQLQQQVGKTVVRAPFSGTIDDVISEQGSVVAPGQSQLFRIVNLRDMYIETDVPERYISNITPGKDVQVEFPILGKKMDAKIRQAGNFINPANRTFKIEVAVSNKDKSIKPNLTAKLKINDYKNEKAILIPQSIISENAEGQQYVYTVTDKVENKAKAKRVIIETGKTQGDYIEVLSGLDNGNEIIDEGARSVKDGQEVKILVVE